MPDDADSLKEQAEAQQVADQSAQESAPATAAGSPLSPGEDGDYEHEAAAAKAPSSPDSALASRSPLPSPEALRAMMDVPLQVAVELARISLPLAEVLALQVGSVVDLDKDPGEPLDLLVNGRPIARGQIVVVNDVLAFHITEAFGQASVQSAIQAKGGTADAD